MMIDWLTTATSQLVGGKQRKAMTSSLSMSSMTSQTNAWERTLKIAKNGIAKQVCLLQISMFILRA